MNSPPVLAEAIVRTEPGDTPESSLEAASRMWHKRPALVVADRVSASSQGCRELSPLRYASPSIGKPIGPLSHSSLRKTADRKSTRLNSSHDQISYAVFCLKKKKRSLTLCRRAHVNR